MSNFAEEIADWYLRLNGFFTILNYVTHKADTELKNHSDLDLLAFRNPHIKEKIGINDVEDICPKLMELIPELNNKQIGIICEIKGGINRPNILKEKLEIGVKRIGITADTNPIVEHLKTNTNFCTTNFEIHKIYASDTQENENWANIKISKMLEFIESRIDKYPEKVAGWNQYGSNIIQYIAYKRR
jgi:hypothetical protein